MFDAYIEELNIHISDKDAQKRILDSWFDLEYNEFASLFFDGDQMRIQDQSTDTDASWWGEMAEFFADYCFLYAEDGDYFTLTSLDGMQSSTTYRKESIGYSEHNDLRIRPSFDNPNEIIDALESRGGDLNALKEEIERRLSK